MHSPLPSCSGDPVVCYFLFPCELSSVVGFTKRLHLRQRHCHPAKNTSQKGFIGVYVFCYALIPTPEINQSSWIGTLLQSCWFVTMACHDLIRLVLIVSRLVVERSIPIRSPVRRLIQTSQNMLCPVWEEKLTHICFLLDICSRSPTLLKPTLKL